MKILIIEDDPNKLKYLKEFILLLNSSITVDTRMSYQSGLFAMLKNDYDLILLDMQLPNYDIKSGEDGYMLRPLAGKDILREVKRKRRKAKVVIITQYDSFNENGNFFSLDDWHTYFSKEFNDIYLKTIFYDPKSSSWKLKLTEILKLGS